VQLDDRRDQAQTKARSERSPALVRTVEAPRDRFLFIFPDAGSRVRNSNDVFIFAADQGELHVSTRGRELHAIRQEIADDLLQAVQDELRRRRFGEVVRLEVSGDMRPDVREKLIGQGAVPQASTPAELQARIDADLGRYGRIIREKGLKAE